jgi:iron(III) transport system ATP-binding protein
VVNIAEGGRQAEAAPTAIEVAGVTKRFGALTVLDDVDLDVPAGTIVALLGPSGCGKTTLLRTIAGLERPDAGEVRRGGQVLSGGRVFVPPERRRIGMVFQDWALFPHMTVAGNVGYGLTGDERASGRVDEALAMVELDGMGDRMPATLSGGQQQRVALARALAPRPTALLLDEPFSNLDTTLRVQVRAEVHHLLRELGVTTVFVTHDQDEAFILGDEVAVMLAGRIVQKATPGDLYSTPVSRAVAEFVGEANLLVGTAHGDRAETVVGDVPLATPARGEALVLLRPECVRLQAGDMGVVDLVEYYGHDAVYRVQLDAGPVVRARVARAEHRRGARVALVYVGPPTIAYDRDGALLTSAGVPAAAQG